MAVSRTSKPSQQQMRDAVNAYKNLKAILDQMENGDLEEDTSDALSELTCALEDHEWEEIIERSLDELDLVAPNREDVDILEDVDETHQEMFRMWEDKELDKDEDEGITGDGKALIDRYMKEHSQIKLEFDPEREFSGGRSRYRRGEDLGIRGPKSARKRFKDDKRWGKLLEALEAIYETDHDRYNRDDEMERSMDVFKHVFGGSGGGGGSSKKKRATRKPAGSDNSSNSTTVRRRPQQRKKPGRG